MSLVRCCAVGALGTSVISAHALRGCVFAAGCPAVLTGCGVRCVSPGTGCGGGCWFEGSALLWALLVWSSADEIHSRASWQAGSDAGELGVSSEEPAKFSNCTLWGIPAGGALAAAATPGTSAMFVWVPQCCVRGGVLSLIMSRLLAA